MLQVDGSQLWVRVEVVHWDLGKYDDVPFI